MPVKEQPKIEATTRKARPPKTASIPAEAKDEVDLRAAATPSP